MTSNSLMSLDKYLIYFMYVFNEPVIILLI